MLGSRLVLTPLGMRSKMVLTALAVLAIVSAGTDSALARYRIVKLKQTSSYDVAYGQVHQQLTALQLRRISGAKCRHEAAVRWLEEASLDDDLAFGRGWTDHGQADRRAGERDYGAEQAASLYGRATSSIDASRFATEHASVAVESDKRSKGVIG